MKHLKSLWILFLIIGCSSTQKTVEEDPEDRPDPNRIQIERVGQGAELEKDLAALMRNGERVKAMRICNDVLFSSRSPEDRETAEFWRTLLLTLEELDAGNYVKASNVLKDNREKISNPERLYQIELLQKILKSMSKLAQQSQDGASGLQKLEQTNAQLRQELGEADKKVKKLEKVLQELESVN